jgi:mRNA-degrading endonuclease toxin of MazEF toxin-antitoxin module
MEGDYFKDFDKWNKIKQKIDTNDRKLFYYEKEVWWVAMGVNVGSEQDGKGEMFVRPVLIYKKTRGGLFIGIPLTSTLKDDSIHIAFYFEYGLHTALIFQLKSYDSKRLTQKNGIYFRLSF